MNRIILFIIVLSVIGAVFLTLGIRILENGSPTLPNSVVPLPDKNLSDLIILEKPLPNQLINNNLTITGRAKGYWFFEASFPIKVYDDNGIEIGVVVAQADGEWMTEDFVDFHAVLKFSKPTTETGTLVLEKDNPSGLAENSAELRVPIRFDLNNWSEATNSPISDSCKITGCSGQICSEEDVITTCEYKEEYACYRTAKCERQENGKCGWTPTEEIVACLGALFQAESEANTISD